MRLTLIVALIAFGQTWPPAGVYVAARDAGVTPPVLVTQVKPQYTPEAMRAKIQGAVGVLAIVGVDGRITDARVSQSLDRAFGLDMQAIAAMKQWTFRPGLKDGVAVPVMIHAQLAFTLRDRPDGSVPTTGPVTPPPPVTSIWPEEFRAPEESAALGSGWIESTTPLSPIQIKIDRPDTWSMDTSRLAGGGPMMLMSNAGNQVIIVGQPRVMPAPMRLPVPEVLFPQFADTLRKQLSSRSNPAQFGAQGQVQIGDRWWLWLDIDVSMQAMLAANAPPALQEAARAANVGNARTWAFTTGEGNAMLQVMCIAQLPRDAPAEEIAKMLARAGTEFAAILKRMTISAK